MAVTRRQKHRAAAAGVAVSRTWVHPLREIGPCRRLRRSSGRNGASETKVNKRAVVIRSTSVDACLNVRILQASPCYDPRTTWPLGPGPATACGAAL
jgi:hypothetical protein